MSLEQSGGFFALTDGRHVGALMMQHTRSITGKTSFKRNFDIVSPTHNPNQVSLLFVEL